MIKVGITGQSGFIGTYLLNYLSLFKDRFEIIEFNDIFFEDNQSLINFVSKCNVVVHLAGVNRHNEENYIYRKNIELAEKLIESCKEANSKAHILFSSSIQEERNNIYGNAKKIAREKLIEWSKINGSKFTGLLIPNVFGPFGRPFYNSVISTFSHQLVNNEQPKIEIDANLKLIYVGELVELIRRLIEEQKESVIEKYIVPHSNSIKVSDILAKLMEFKSEYILNGIIPKLENKFEIDLFNTFRSYINFREFFPFKYKLNKDDRGFFVETMKLNIGGQVSFSNTKPGITRGNHFHTRKIERFAVIKGKALIQLRKIGTNEVINFELNGNEPSFVDMPIWYTHNITNIGEDELITLFWINEFYNPDDPDTYFEKV